MPRTHGDSFIHVSEIDFIVESEQEIIELQPPRIGPVEEAIGKHIAGLVDDGSCLQLGIGGIPDAVLLFLHEKNDLGIHSEMFSEGVVDLYNEGVITNRNKTINRDKMAATFLMGTRRLYDFVDDNPAVNMFPVNIINDPYLIGQNDRVVAINSAIQVDLMGQVVADTMGAAQFTGIGGQVDFVRGAAPAATARRSSPCRPRRRRGAVSRIVAALSPGTAVTTMRADVDYIVTEHGVAHLRGKGLRERAEALIDIADPNSETRSARRRHRLRSRPPPRHVGPPTEEEKKPWIPGDPRPQGAQDAHHRQRLRRPARHRGQEARRHQVLILTDPGVACCGRSTRREAAARRRPRRRRLRQGRSRAADQQRARDRRHHQGRRLRPHRRLRWRLRHRRGQGRRGAGHQRRQARGLRGRRHGPRKGLPLIAVPTTAGTGSEVTAIAIFANEKLNVKQGAVSPFLIPNIALVDPVLTYSCPPGVTAASGMDALIHNIEAYISVNATMHTDPLAAEGIKLISKSIRTAVFDGENAWARHNMAMGSLLGGIAFGNAGVGAVHAMSYPGGACSTCPTGSPTRSCSRGSWNTTCWPARSSSWRSASSWARTWKASATARVARSPAGVAHARRRPRRAAVPQRGRHPESAIPALVEGALTQARLWNNNPRKFTAEDMAQVYRNMAVKPGTKPVAEKKPAAKKAPAKKK